MNTFKSQVFLGSKPHYNLRTPKGVKPSAVYLIININGKQYKVSCGVKVNPSHWIKKEYRAMVSSCLSELENVNNLIVNKKIVEYNTLYVNLINYLCNHIDEIENPLNAIQTTFNMKKKVKKEKISATLLTALRNHKMSQESYDIFYGQLKEFIDWIGKNYPELSLFELSNDIYSGYKSYLFDKKITHKITGESVKAENNTVLAKLKNIITIIGYMEGTEELCAKLKRTFKDIKTFKQQENQVYLDDSEIERIYNLDLEGEEDIARDLFIFQLSSGQRFSDIKKLSGVNLLDYVSDDMISITQKKTKAKVSFPIDEKAKSVLKKYNYVLPSMQLKDINRLIKKVCEKANIVEICHCVELRGGDTYEYDVEKFKLIGSHTTRRSFISNAIKENIEASIIRKISGHKTDSAFERYNRIDSEDAVKAMLKAKNAPQTSGNGSGTASNTSNEQSINNDLEESRKVLFYLGASAVEVYQDDDIERIHRLIFSYENVIAEKCGVDYKFLKDLFNSDRPFIDKIKIIQSLLNN